MSGRAKDLAKHVSPGPGAVVGVRCSERFVSNVWPHVSGAYGSSTTTKLSTARSSPAFSLGSRTKVKDDSSSPGEIAEQTQQFDLFHLHEL